MALFKSAQRGARVLYPASQSHSDAEAARQRVSRNVAGDASYQKVDPDSLTIRKGEITFRVGEPGPEALTFEEVIRRVREAMQTDLQARASSSLKAREKLPTVRARLVRAGLPPKMIAKVEPELRRDYAEMRRRIAKQRSPSSGVQPSGDE